MARSSSKREKYNKHGLTNHPLYAVIRDIKKRCYTESDTAYRNYGAKGVRVCKEWVENPATFIEWALANGWRKGLQVDKDIKAIRSGVPPLLYSPEWCSIVTRKENNLYKKNSRRYTFNGKTQTCVEWAKELDIDPSTLMHRINKYGMVEDAAFSKRKIKYPSKQITMSDAVKIREMRKGGMPCREIAKIYRMDVSNIFLIVSNKTWK